MKLSEIKPNPKNPRVIKDDKYEQLKKSIKEFPKMLELRPIVIDKDNIILGGNMRYRALQELGYKDVPVVRAEDLTDEEKREFIIKDNIPYGEWDWDELANEYELEELEEWGMDVESKAFLEPDEKDDQIPEIDENEPPKAKLGDIYLLGEHRVMCGDSTKVEDVEKLMNGQLADQVITDPPYNVDYEGKTKDKLKIENDKKTDEEFRQFLTDSFVSMASVMKDGAVFYIWHADSEGYNFRGALKDAGLETRQCLIWEKNSMVMGRQDYHWKHEPCLYGWKDGASHLWNSDRTQTTLLKFDRPASSKLHPTMKPIELISYQITNNSKGQDIVLDLFLGSGSTLIASEKTNRKCYGMELDPKYVDVIIQRWEDYTGEKAKKVL